jgi:hypothetical protein
MYVYKYAFMHTPVIFRAEGSTLAYFCSRSQGDDHPGADESVARWISKLEIRQARLRVVSIR